MFNFVRICWRNTLTYLFFMIICNKKRLMSSFIADLPSWRDPYLQLSGCVNSSWNVEVARGALTRHQFLSYLFSMPWFTPPFSSYPLIIEVLPKLILLISLIIYKANWYIPHEKKLEGYQIKITCVMKKKILPSPQIIFYSDKKK